MPEIRKDTVETRGPVRKTGSGYVIVTRPSGGSSEKEGGLLAKRAAKSAMELSETGVKRAAKAVERSEERRVGKECRSLCDWSSDVCSSDLWRVERERRRVFGKTRGKIGDGTFGNGRKARRESRRAKIYADRGRPDGGPQRTGRRRRRAGCRAGEAFDAGGLWPGRIPRKMHEGRV